MSMRRVITLVACLVALLTTTSGAQAATRPKAPPIAGKTLAGTKVTLAQFRGKPVFINVWSSW
jgi:hypothetical protein